MYILRFLLFLFLSAITFLPARAQLQIVGKPQPLSPDSLQLIQPRCSPDGQLIAAAGLNYKGIFLLDSSGTFLRQITDFDGAGYRFEWSPDGRHILARVTKSVGRRRVSAIALLNVATGAERYLTSWTGSLGLPGWVPGGGAVYFLHRGELVIKKTGEQRPDEKEEFLYARFPEQTAPHRLIAFASGDRLFVQDVRRILQTIFVYPDKIVLNPLLSPDRQWVAFDVTGEGLQIGHFKGKPIFEVGNYREAAWFPSAKWIACVKTTDDGLRILNSDLYAFSLATRSVLQLTDTPDVLERNPCWTPDGRFLLYDDALTGRIVRLRIKFE